MKIREIIRKYISDNNLSEDVPNRTIARALYQLYPDMCPSLETLRKNVCAVRGNQGYKKNKIKDPEKIKFFRENRDPAIVGREYNLNPIKIGFEDLKYKYRKALVLSDIHLPYHDMDVLTTAIEHGVKNGVDSIYLNGDILDCAAISRFLKDSHAPTISEERDMYWDFVQYLNDKVGLPITFKMGNHEERWEHYLKRNTPELAEVSDFTFKNFLRLDELNIDFVESRQKMYMGKLIVIHGHEFGESVFSPVNPARGLFLRAKSSVLAGHNHQTSEHHENNLKGDSMACYSTGALCQLNPNYRPFAYTKWNHGFAIVEVYEDDTFHVDNLRINKKDNGTYFVT